MTDIIYPELYERIIMDQIEGYQVVNKFGNPASTNDLGDLCIFKDMGDVTAYLENLSFFIDEDEMRALDIVPVTLTFGRKL